MTTTPHPETFGPLLGINTLPTGEAIRAAQRLVPLGPWLERCRTADVPYVPAQFSPPIPLEQLWTALDGQPTPELDAAREWIDKARINYLKARRRVYIRWEDCSSEDAKAWLSRGKGWQPEFAFNPTLDDPRLSDCAVTDPQRLVIRPWIEAPQIDGYPLELRVFYGPEGLLGISNYHPMRPLDASNPAVQPAIDNALQLAHRLYDPAIHPIGFTADFLGTPYGGVLFLEGGPPHVPSGIGPSAHPCCFAPGRISGIALTPQLGALTY